MQNAMEQNKRLLVRWFQEVWNEGKRETITELYAENAILHDGGKKLRGRDEFTRFYDAFRSQFSDFKAEPIVVLAEGDLACLRWSVKFRHKATDTPVQVTGTSVVRVRDGQFVEAWQNWDAASLARQLPSNVTTEI